MNKLEYVSANEIFIKIYEQYARLLPKESSEHVEGLVENAELEMACESFVLSIIEQKLILDEMTRNDLLTLCLTLGLDHNSVFRSDFWKIAFPVLSSNLN